MFVFQYVMVFYISDATEFRTGGSHGSRHCALHERDE